MKINTKMKNLLSYFFYYKMKYPTHSKLLNLSTDCTHAVVIIADFYFDYFGVIELCYHLKEYKLFFSPKQRP